MELLFMRRFYLKKNFVFLFHTCMKQILLFITIFQMLSCSESENEYRTPVYDAGAIKHLYWLSGTWKMVMKDTARFQQWERKNDGSLQGKIYMVHEQDTVLLRELSLQQNGNELHLTLTEANKIKMQLRFTHFNTGEFIFENAENDFPKKIVYKNTQPDFLCSRQEGLRDGHHQLEDICMVKVK